MRQLVPLVRGTLEIARCKNVLLYISRIDTLCARARVLPVYAVL